MLKEEVWPLLSGLVTHIPELFRERADSLPEFTKETRNDFLTLVETDLIAVEYLPAILDRTQTLVAGYYLAAASLLVDVPGINVRNVLGKLSTQRDPIDAILGSGASAFKFVATESHCIGLPLIGEGSTPSFTVGLEAHADDLNLTLTEQRIAEIDQKLELNAKKDKRDEIQATYLKERATVDRSMAKLNEQRDAAALKELEQRIQLAEDKANREIESLGFQRGIQEETLAATKARDAETLKLQKEQAQLMRERQEAEEARNKSASFGIGRNALATIDELSNLSTGKTFEVQFKRDGNELTIPVTVRLAVTDTDSTSMKNIVTGGARAKTFPERWKMMKRGKLSAVKELIFCNDIFEESRRMRQADKSGFYAHMMKRLSSNFLSGLFSLSPSINNASAVLVISQTTADLASLELGRPLSEPKARERVFKATATMLIIVVDTKWDSVTFYHRGVAESTTMSSRDLVRSSKGSGGGNVDDIVSAYIAGSSPN